MTQTLQDLQVPRQAPYAVPDPRARQPGVRAALRAGLAALCASLIACATVPPVPPQVAPVLALPRTSDGEGALLVDVSDGPTRVVPDAAPERACVTPCALALPLGAQSLTLHYRDRWGNEHIDKTRPLLLPEPQVLRRTLERIEIEHPVRRKVALTAYLGGQLVLLAAALTCIGSSDASRATARGLAGAGGAMFVLSLPLSIGTFQRSAGAQTQFPLYPPGSPPP